MAAETAVAPSLAQEYRSRLERDSDIRDHLAYMHRRVIGWRFPRVLELGTRSGNSTSAFLAALELSRTGGCLWSVDIADPDVPAWWRELPCWRFLKADDMSEQALAFGPPAVHVLFIDTSHEYSHTLAELRAYVPRVAPGGVVLMHDTEYAYAGGKHARDADPHESDVGRALDAYCAETGLKWENRPGCYGLGVMEIPR